jgi:hypothetical protein
LAAYLIGDATAFFYDGHEDFFRIGRQGTDSSSARVGDRVHDGRGGGMLAISPISSIQISLDNIYALAIISLVISLHV